ncbi:MAG: hypothetical protein CMH61_01985 [Nanoarchaeota archaeon]|nr:hypothetical protein [Nanoarchaeota archaeon]
MKLLLVRHGQTIENRERRLQGHIPGHLSELGKKQAQLVGERLKNEEFSVIYCSDLKRCIDTSQPIVQFHPSTPFVKDNRLREMSYGIFEGKLLAEADLEALDGDLYHRHPDHGESFIQLHERMSTFHKFLLSQNHSGTVLLVSHGTSLKILQGILLGLSLEDTVPRKLGFYNTGVSEFVLENGVAKAIELNSISHLRDV